MISPYLAPPPAAALDAPDAPTAHRPRGRREEGAALRQPPVGVAAQQGAARGGGAAQGEGAPHHAAQRDDVTAVGADQGGAGAHAWRGGERKGEREVEERRGKEKGREMLSLDLECLYKSLVTCWSEKGKQ